MWHRAWRLSWLAGAMRTSTLGRMLAVLAALSLAAVACSSTTDTESVGADTPSSGEVEDESSEADGGDSSSDDVPDDADDAADPIITDLADIDLDDPVDSADVETLATSLTGLPVTAEQITCMTDNADGDTQLALIYHGFQAPGFQFTPEAFTALTVNVHDCVESIDLASSLIALSGGSGDPAAFTSCVTNQLSDEQTGDLAYTGLVALQVQFPVPEGAQQITVDAASECINADSLTDQLAAAREQSSGFTQAVDRECVSDGLTDDFVRAFWQGVVTSETASDELEPLLDGCSDEYDSGLAQELPGDFEPFAGTRALAAVDPQVRNGVYNNAPDDVLEDGVDYQARFITDDGVILIDLFESTAPVTVNSFVALARDGYYDRTFFHRVLDGFMAQGGDPSNTGSGGPGYTFDDERSGLTPVDRRGLLAMANSGPNTNGSQFFITLDAASWLDGLHTVFGEVIEGDEVLAEIDLRNPDAPSSRGQELISVEIIEG